MRQYKQFVNRLTHQAHYDDILDKLTTREGVLNMHSLVWNQLSSPAYTDMLRWCWHKTDPDYSAIEPHNTQPAMVRKIEFGFAASECQVGACSSHAFIRCSHCGKLMCLEHFLERTCFHHSTRLEDAQNATDTYSYSDESDLEADGDEDELISGLAE